LSQVPGVRLQSKKWSIVCGCAKDQLQVARLAI